MDDKDFAARVLSVIKNNLFEIKKLFFNLDDCVAKNDFDNLQKNFDDAQSSIYNLQNHKTRLENELDNKSSEIISLLKQNSSMQDKIKNLHEELERRENSLTKAKNKIDELSNALEEKKSQLAEKISLLEKYAENYSELEKAYNSYQKLSDKTKFGLEGIFGVESSPTSFLAGALMEGHLESLFDYVATAINNGSEQNEIEILRGLFDFAFNAVNNGRPEKVFARLEIFENDNFDSEEMRKTSDSSQSGTVKNILLVGYKYIRTDKVVKPSLVCIG
ncbi:MAG: hypothetical protein IK062_03030 [Selenomonadaceae bacterium]|nr:hypothetical protein [Selenomonadaceae bacterium]